MSLFVLTIVSSGHAKIFLRTLFCQAKKTLRCVPLLFSAEPLKNLSVRGNYCSFQCQPVHFLLNLMGFVENLNVWPGMGIFDTDEPFESALEGQTTAE